MSHYYRENLMQKLIAKYIANPSAIRHAAVISYYRKHPMAECMLSPAEQALLRKLVSIDYVGA
jgi:hypothetical protein